MVKEKSAASEKLLKDRHKSILTVSRSSWYSSLDQTIFANSWSGWVIVTTARSKQDKTRIIKWHSFFRSCGDFMRQIITTEFRNSPEIIKITFTRHKSNMLTKVPGSILNLSTCYRFFQFSRPHIEQKNKYENIEVHMYIYLFKAYLLTDRRMVYPENIVPVANTTKSRQGNMNFSDKPSTLKYVLIVG